MRTFIVFVLAIFLSAIAAQSTFAASLPSMKIPDGFGISVHFLESPAADLDMIKHSGTKIIRRDMTWSEIERSKGVYDFSKYDKLVNAAKARDLRIIFILDYSNSLYEPQMSVKTDCGRAAYANFAAAAAKRYAGSNVIWEIWNEPDGSFWKPAPDPTEYMQLVKVAVPAIRQADPNSTIIAPACSGINFKFLEACIKQGLLDLVDGVSVHPYSMPNPEAVFADVKGLRTIMSKYRSDYQTYPVFSTEWGYSSTAVGDTTQANYLARIFLINQYLGIPVSIWYDWKNDGNDPANKEHNFGLVTSSLALKPAYTKLQRLTFALHGMHFYKRLPSSSNDYLLIFTDGHKYKIAAWTTGPSHTLKTASKIIHLSGNPSIGNFQANSNSQN